MSGSETSVPPAQEESYRSPYALRFTYPASKLAEGFDAEPWNDPQAEARESFAAWEAAHVGGRVAAWGPPARQYPAPTLPTTEEAYLRERVLSVAALHIGLAYQHHHLPSWIPPQGWPWLKVAAGANGPGLDCSNFTSFVINYGLGIRLPTGIGMQGRTLRLAGPGGVGCLSLQKIEARRYSELATKLAPADLVYFKNATGRIRHVGFWVGSIGGDTPLILDCTDHSHPDARQQMIPTGVHLRPFLDRGFYWNRFSHAHRVIGAGLPACETSPRAFPEGDDRA